MKKYSKISANRVWSRTTGGARAVRLGASVANGSGVEGRGGEGGSLTSTTGIGHAPPHIKVAIVTHHRLSIGNVNDTLNHRYIGIMRQKKDI